MSRFFAACVVILGVSGPAFAQASSDRVPVELSASVGWGGLSRFDDSTNFGSGLSVGGRIDVRPSGRLGLGVDVRGIAGLDQPVSSALALSGYGSFDLSASARARPYVLGGIGLLRTHHRAALPGQPINHTDEGWGPMFGFGVRVPVTGRLSLRTGLSHSPVLWQSRENLSETHATLALGYRW